MSEATGANFLQELEDWYTWLDNALVLDALMQMATEEAEQSSTGETAVTSAAFSPYCINSLNFDLDGFFFPTCFQSHQTRVPWPPAPWDIDCPSPWRSFMRSCIKWKFSTCYVSFLWADRGTRYLSTLISFFLEIKTVVWRLSSFVFCCCTGAQDAGWVPSHPGTQQSIWQTDMEKIHSFKSCGARPEWELRL